MLYFHIPFCVSKCAYCAFYSIPGWNDRLLDDYTDALIAQVKDFGSQGSFDVSSVYFGGGTPTVLGADRLCRVLEAVKSSAELHLNAEVTLEANPGTVDENALLMLKSYGFNRLSLGAQSFNDATLKLLNRAHTGFQFESCYNSARKVGFDNISADLIFALPNEDVKMLSNSVKRLVELKPEHISVYGLSIEEGTPLYSNKDDYTFPTEDEEELQYEAVCDILIANGYGHYEISNFALEGKEAVHNTGYWKRTPYFGFGAGAHSFWNRRRFSTPQDILAYISNAKKGFLAPTDYFNVSELDAEEEEAERIMLGLRLKEGVALSQDLVPEVVLTSGLGKYADGKLYLTEKGFRVSNAIISMILN